MKRKAKRLLALVAAVLMALTALPTSALAASYTPPSGAPFGGEGAYKIGDKVPQEVLNKAVKAVSKGTSDGGMVGIPYSTYDCSDFVELFLRDYVGFKKSEVQSYTAQNFYNAFKNAGQTITVPNSKKDTDDECENYLIGQGVQPGTILFYEDPSRPGEIHHVGVYHSKGKVIDSISAGRDRGIAVGDFHVNVYDISHPEKGGIYAFAFIGEENGKLKLKKVSSNTDITKNNSCYSLEGAVYYIYNSADKKVGEITTDDKGEGTLEELPVGENYYCVEHTPPPGYAKSSIKPKFDIEGGKTTTVKVDDAPQHDPVSVLIRKIDAKTGQPVAVGDGSLKDAQFTVKYYDGQYTKAQLSGKTPLRTWVFKTDADGVVIFDKSYRVSGDAFYTDNSGNETLPLGTVTIQETKAPTGYLIDNTLHVVNITENTNNAELVKSYNPPVVSEPSVSGGVATEKWDYELDSKTPQGDATLAGAVFEIVNDSKASVRVGDTDYAPGAVITTITTDANGSATTANNLLPFGSYILREKTPPRGYTNKGETSRNFTIRENGVIVKIAPPVKNEPVRGGVVVEKWDAETDTKKPQGDASLKGAVFEIVNKSVGNVRVNGHIYAPNAVVHTLTTDEHGEASTSNNLLPYGSYELREKTAPTGYQHSGKLTQSFEIRTEGQIVQLKTSATAIKNNPERGGVAIEKWDAELDARTTQGDATLQGAVFDIYNRSRESVRVGGVDYAPGKVVYTLTTDADGKATTAADTLPYGSYEIIERTAPTGYLHTGKLSQPFEIRQNGVIVPLKTSATAIKNNPVRGGVAVEKWDAETDKRSPQGDATLAGAKFDVYNRSKESVKVNGTLYAPNTIVCTLTTDADGKAATAANALPYGSYEIIERTAPTGYLHTGKLTQTFQIRTDGEIVQLKTSATAIKNNPERGGVAIEKWDMELDARTPQGDATLQGAVFDVHNRSKASVRVGGVDYAPGKVVCSLTTDADGKAATAADALPYGSYEIIERTAPTGYLHTGKLSQTFQIRQNGVIVQLKTSADVIKNNPIRGGVLVEKWDMEINRHEKQGGATLQGAKLEIVNQSAHPVLVGGTLYQPGQIVYTMLTDKTGTATTAANLLPYGSYLVREVEPPQGYLAKGKLLQTFQIREHGVIVKLNTSDTAIKNNPIRGDLKGVKIADGAVASRLSNVPFKITSKSTGESHTIVTDVNGEFNTASSWVPHSQNTNRGEKPEDGIWFGELWTLDDNLGALLYDTYVLEEQPCASNEGMKLLTFEVSVYRHNVTVDLGTLTDDYEVVPEIYTTAMDRDSGEQYAYVDEHSVIVDTVYCGGLTKGKTYTVKGVLMDKSTGREFLDEGETVTAEKTFTAGGEFRSINTSFAFNSTSLRGKEVVVFETLVCDGKIVAEHKDITDTEQTVRYLDPRIGTTATDQDGEKELYISDETVIKDVIAFNDLIPRRKYTLESMLIDKETEDVIPGCTQKHTIVPKQFDGTVEVEFTLDSREMAGREVVAFEYLYYNGDILASHADIDDEGQTVTFLIPEIGTTASDENGEKELYISDETEIRDVVEYENLCPNKEYTLKASLVSKQTGEVLPDGELTATFTPDEPDGAVFVSFNIDSRLLAGEDVVAFEHLFMGDVEIAVHADIEDEGQTVTFLTPEIGTTATDQDGEKELFISGETVIKDVIEYENLAPNHEYTIKGVLVNKATEEVLPDGEVTGIFTPDEPDGAVYVTFTVDSRLLAGKEVVAFESLYLGDVLIASHEAIEDEGQTVVFLTPEIGTTASNMEGESELLISDETAIKDVIEYENLAPGIEHTIKGVLIDKSTGEALPGGEVTGYFTPEESEGAVYVVFTIDSRTLAGKDVVAFERLYLGEIQIAAHADIEDEGQTVSFIEPEIGTTATDIDGEKELNISDTTTIIDVVEYGNLTPGKEYTLRASLVKKETGEVIDGSETEATFTPEESSGEVEVSFTIDSRLLAGKEVVAFEHLFFGDVEISVHADIEDEDQTVAFVEPEIGTTAAGEDGEKELCLNDTATIIDTVAYSNLTPGKEYTLKASLVNKETGEIIPDSEMDVTFTPKESEGEVEVAFTIDSRLLAGKEVVAFEHLFFGDVEIVVHADIEDEDQTVTFVEPEIGTTATGEDGEKELPVSDTTTIIDTVSYTNLVPGKAYTLNATLVNKATGEALPDGRVTALFTPEESDGAVYVTFTVDSRLLKGQQVVAFETLLLGDVEIAIHADIEDEDQTVSFTEPEIGTKATGEKGEKELPIAKETKIVDTVSYKNLVVGKEYTLKGILMRKDTGKALKVDDKKVSVEATFTPEKSDGETSVTFTFDSTGLEDTSVVVFEKVYLGDVQIGSHEDIEDADQTVKFVSPTTPPPPKTGRDTFPLVPIIILGAGLLCGIGGYVYAVRRRRNGSAK